MTVSEINIRAAVLEDAESILEIYAFYVENTAITFEHEVPSLAEFTERMKQIMKKYPYIVIEKEGRIEGYAYANAFRSKAAYGWACEMTIYLKHGRQKCGMGRKLYEALEEKLKHMGILNCYACIGYPQVEDEFLTTNSADFHAHLGYQKAGIFHKCGYKFNRWYDMIYMEKIIGEHSELQPEVNFDGRNIAAGIEVG